MKIQKETKVPSLNKDFVLETNQSICFIFK